ncbi:SH2 domain protein [Dictyocaulus viviparus]|uniref:Tyrosine-protein kinase n=1 Tax=Dictyocaulus viviparus TaxID=29172 RepID=A0A0D8Y8Q7_DICVI|nr:SH2 domain protein [Dictyocaulus viviparus]
MQGSAAKADGARILTDQHLIGKTVLHGSSYYHGMISTSDVSKLLEEDGDFLLRKELLDEGVLVATLSVRCGNTIKHFMINHSDDGEFYVENLRATTVEDLIRKHLVNGEPLSKASQAILKRPIPRQEWMLNHDDITIKECDRSVRGRLMKEARLLRSLNHENICQIYGVALHYNPIILVLEHFHISLFLHLNRNVGRISASEKRRFVCEAAAGLAYLANSECIHRDIATRNCMLNESLTVKLSGFSLCEPAREMRESLNIAIAVKWQAPEVLENREYSLRSDVWSFGILMWEVYSEGAEPYGDMTPNAAKEVILKNGYRMPIPKDCPDTIAKIITACWEVYPRRRPCMSAIHLVIRDF